MLKLALIGAGEHAEKSHAPALALYAEQNQDKIELTAVCDINIKKALNFCQIFGFKNAYSNIDEMLAKNKIDGCLCTVPVPSILETTCRLLNKGIPTLIEKPLGININQSQQSADMIRETGVKHMVSANRRFTPFVKQALEWSKEHGAIHYVRSLMARPNRNEPEFIWNTSVHAVDTLRFIAGEVVDLAVRTMKGDELSGIWKHVDFEFENGIIGSLDILPTCGINIEIYELYGESFQSVVQIRDFFKEIEFNVGIRRDVKWINL